MLSIEEDRLCLPASFSIQTATHIDRLAVQVRRPRVGGQRAASGNLIGREKKNLDLIYQPGNATRLPQGQKF